jgi:SAM-dependent methyltransferase
MSDADTPHQGFQIGGQPGDLFKGTADYYAAYRRPYPPPVVDHLVERGRLDGTGRLLDAGCGTGQVFQAMARYFEDVLAIDLDPGMVEASAATISRAGLTNVVVRQLRAEDLAANDGPLRMAIFGASFHWTDRPLVGDKVYDLLVPGGCLAVLSPGGIHSGTTEWEATIREVLNRQIGPERRAGKGVYQEGERHEAALRRTHFTSIEVTHFPVREEWSVDQIVGYLYSTSYACKSILGERAGAFERDVRESLLRLSPEGQFEKDVEYTVILAER